MSGVATYRKRVPYLIQVCHPIFLSWTWAATVIQLCASPLTVWKLSLCASLVQSSAATGPTGDLFCIVRGIARGSGPKVRWPDWTRRWLRVTQSFRSDAPLCAVGGHRVASTRIWVHVRL